MGKPTGYHLFFTDREDLDRAERWVAESAKGETEIYNSAKHVMLRIHEDRDAMLFKLSW